MIYNYNLLRHVFFKIREIDPTKNGYVTYNELQDIFQIVYDKNTEFKTQSIKDLCEPFRSTINN